jgi:hypothetical protein
LLCYQQDLLTETMFGWLYRNFYSCHTYLSCVLFQIIQILLIIRYSQ